MKHHDPVNHPSHYKKGGIEVIDIIEAYNLNFRLGNVVKYILRHNDKGKPIEDLEKSLFYLIRDVNKKKEERARLEAEKKALTELEESDTLWTVEVNVWGEEIKK